MKNSASPLRGVIAASVTPLGPDLSIDHARLADHGRRLLETGCDGVALFGTTGEAVSFTREERMRALDAILAAGVPPDRLVVGTGCCAIGDTVALTRHALASGVARVLVLPPYYYKNLSEHGLVDAYRRAIIGTDDERLRLLLYHFPRLTGVPIGIEVIRTLREEFPRIIAGVKDSSGDPESLGAFCGAEGGMAVYPGTERLLLAGLRSGAAGCISGSANVTAPMMAAVYGSCSTGTPDEALQDQLSGIRRVLDRYPLIAAVKYLVSRRSGHADWMRVRPPLVPMRESDGARLEEELAGAGFSMA